MPNWVDIKKCPIWKELGVTECDSCDTKIQCWGKESVLPELTNAHRLLLTYAMLGTILRQQRKDKK